MESGPEFCRLGRLGKNIAKLENSNIALPRLWKLDMKLMKDNIKDTRKTYKCKIQETSVSKCSSNLKNGNVYVMH